MASRPWRRNAAPLAYRDHHHRQQRDRDHDQGDHAEMRLDPGHIAKSETAEHKQRHPPRTTDHVESLEAMVGHAANAGDERREGANDRHEARQQHRQSAMAAEVLLRALQVRELEEAIAPAEGLLSEPAPDGVEIG